ncbi:hypothetical protein LDENG_00242880 [Lucifuga dentata]|nr:hypothetical protein LDENG_00242880 [Lucifuga dentata]
MTELINTCDSSVGGASGDERMFFQILPDSIDRFSKLPRQLPSIVVEPMDDGGEVESGELRWPSDDMTDAEQGEAHAEVKGSHVPVEKETESGEQLMGGV